MIERDVTFAGAAGALSGKLAVPADPRGWALFLHCFTCGADIAAARRISRGLAERGIGVLRFDFTGLGRSEGDFADTNFSTSVEDVLAAAAWLEAAHGEARIVVGHSLGGAVALAAAPRLPGVRAVATIGAPCHPGHVAHLLEGVRDTLQTEGEAEVTLGVRTFRVRAQLLEDLSHSGLEASLRRLRDVSLLLLHSPGDDIVHIDNARCLYELAHHPKSFVTLDGADHLLSRAEDADYVAGLVSAWAGRVLEAPQAAADPDPTGGTVEVDLGPAGLTARVAARSHRWRIDEPVSAGGADSGPTPYEQLLAALGSCTALTLRMFADRKGWPLQGVELRLRHARDHRRDSASPGRTTRLERIEGELVLRGPLDEAQTARLVQIAGKCPVHRTLSGPVQISTTVTGSG